MDSGFRRNDGEREAKVALDGRDSVSLIHQPFQPAVYIMASRKNGTLYIGVTSNLAARIGQHREGIQQGFTKKYGVKLLVYYELHETMASAILREKQLKEWKRIWKIELIETANRGWHDLYSEVLP